jgi:hypothetical protein
MQMKELFFENGKRIAIYDNIFDPHFRSNAYSFANNSHFIIGWADGAIVEKQANRFIHSVYSDDDVERLGILKRIALSPAAKELDGYKLQKTILNLSTAADTNYIHTHPEDKILLYYVNLEWFDGWHGETLFFSDDGKDVVFTSSYTPGRLLVFDAKIQHTIRPQSHIAAQYRFTLALIFNKQ